jgi:hypothetical protein
MRPESAEVCSFIQRATIPCNRAIFYIKHL